MSTFFVFAVLSSVGAALALTFRKRFEEMLPLSVFAVILLLYFSGLAGTLHAGYYSVLGAAFLCAGYVVLKAKTSWNDSLALIATPGFLAFALFVLLAWWGHEGRLATAWDEFSHWSLVVKNMYSLHDFGNASGSTVSFRSYPPASSLFAYFWTRLGGSFCEADLLRSMNLFFWSLLLPVFKTVRWKQPIRLILALALCLLLPVSMQKDAYLTNYVDALVGILGAYVLFTLFSNELDTATGIGVAAGLAILPLVKNIGAVFSVFVLFAFACAIMWSLPKRRRNILFFVVFLLLLVLVAFAVYGLPFGLFVLALSLIAFLMRRSRERVHENLLSRQSGFKQAEAPRKKTSRSEKKSVPAASDVLARNVDVEEPRSWKASISSLRPLLWLAIFSLAFLAGKYSWDIYLKLTETGVQWNVSNISKDSLMSLWPLHETAVPYRFVTIRNFFTLLWSVPLGKGALSPSVAGCFLLFLAAGAALLSITGAGAQRRGQPSLRCAVYSVYATFPVYLLVLLLSYLFLFGEYESVRCASFPRYWGTFLVYSFAFFTCMLFHSMDHANARGRLLTGVLLVCLLIPFFEPDPFAAITYEARSSAARTIESRRPYENVKRAIGTINPAEDKVWIISQHTTGYSFLVLRYNLTPTIVGGGWSLGTPAGEQDIWTRKITAEEWVKELKEYQWLYLFSVENTFVQNFASLFEDPATIANDAFYKVRADGDSVVLTYVDI